MSYDIIKNSAQPALQPGRSPSTAPAFSAAVRHPGWPAQAGAMGSPPQRLVASGEGAFQPQQGAFMGPQAGPQMPQPQAWSNPFQGAALQGQQTASPSGAFGIASSLPSTMPQPFGRFGGSR